MDDLAEEDFTVRLIFPCIEDMFMPEAIQLLRPWHHRLVGVDGDQIEELAIL